MKKYKQLSLAQRYQIESLSKTGQSQTQIACLLGVHKSTICRELNRNTPTRGRTAGQYIGKDAQRKTDLRHLLKAKQVLLTEELKKRIASLMKHQKWYQGFLFSFFLRHITKWSSLKLGLANYNSSACVHLSIVHFDRCNLSLNIKIRPSFNHLPFIIR